MALNIDSVFAVFRHLTSRFGTVGKAGTMNVFTTKDPQRTTTEDTRPPLRGLAIAMAVLISLSALLPTGMVVAYAAGGGASALYEAGQVLDNTPDVATEVLTESVNETLAVIPGVRPGELSEESVAALVTDCAKPVEGITLIPPAPTEIESETAEETPTSSEDADEMGLLDNIALSAQEVIARRMEPSLDTSARAGTRISYPYPSGAMAVDLYKDGRRILKGQVADIGGTVYVPVQRFADLFGSFKTVYTAATEQVVITGKNLSITVKVGDPYITVNERIFYTGKQVLSLGGWIFVPLEPMCRALGATVTIRAGYYDASIRSGDPTSVAWASEYYNSTDLYWLSRIISAEARGEPFRGQIAVGNVVLNRVRSSQFPNTVKGVIFDTKYGVQFSPVSSGTIYNTPTASAIQAAKICLEGYTLSSRMLYFYNPAIASSSWIGRTRPYIMTIGNHKFYA